MSTRTSAFVTLAAVVALGYGGVGLAFEAGDLDRAFNNGGQVRVSSTGVELRGFALALQSDNKIVIAGSRRLGADDDFALTRLTADGALDNSFSSDGRLSTNFFGGNDTAYAVIVQASGKIVSAGSATLAGNLDFAMARYNPDGTLDSSFGNNGLRTTLIGSGDDVARAIAIQADGKLLLAGYSWNGLDNDFALARYDANGVLDTSFGSNGVVSTDFGANDLAYALALQSDGKIVVVGNTGTDIAVARYNSNGSLDTDFDTNGLLATDLTVTDQAFAVAIQTDGKLLVAGSTRSNGNEDMVVVRYLSDGVLDEDFDTDGWQRITFANGSDRASALAIQSDGKILLGGVAAGTADNDFANDFALVRLTENGELDTDFGNAGLVSTDFDGGADEAAALGIQSTGRIILAGYATDDVGRVNMAAARYHQVRGTGTGGGSGGGSGSDTVPALAGCSLRPAAAGNPSLDWLLTWLLVIAGVGYLRSGGLNAKK